MSNDEPRIHMVDEAKWEPVGNICKHELGTMHVSHMVGLQGQDTWNWNAKLVNSSFSCQGTCGPEGKNLAKTCAIEALKAMKKLQELGAWATSLPQPESATDVDMGTDQECVLCRRGATGACYHPVAEVRAFILGVHRATERSR